MGVGVNNFVISTAGALVVVTVLGVSILKLWEPENRKIGIDLNSHSTALKQKDCSTQIFTD